MKKQNENGMVRSSKEKAVGRRLLSVLLALCVTCTMLPSVAFAQVVSAKQITHPEMVVEPHLQSREKLPSYTLTKLYTSYIPWEREGRYRLDIHGNQGMLDVLNIDQKIRERIEYVKMDYGITNIPDNCFKDMRLLRHVETPDSVKSIGQGAFYNCNSLEQFDMPNDVTIINNSTFFSCDTLNYIKMPNGVTSIGNYAFMYCQSLPCIDVSSSVASIGDKAFGACTNLNMLVFNSDKAPQMGENMFEGDYGAKHRIKIPEGENVTGYIDGIDPTNNWGLYKKYIMTDQGDTYYKKKIVQKTYGDKAFTNPITTKEKKGIKYTTKKMMNYYGIEKAADINSATGEVTIVGAGADLITGSISDESGNKQVADYILNVKKAPLILEADNKSMEVGGVVPELTYTVNGLLNGDKINQNKSYVDMILSTDTDGKTPGIYDINISSRWRLSGAIEEQNKYLTGKNNYDIIYKKGTLTVKEPEVKLDYAIKSMDKVYGDAAFTNPLTISGDAGDIMYSANNPNVVTIDAVSGGVKIVGAGDTIITASAKNNVKASYSTSIKKAALELKANNKSITVGEALPDFTYTATGLVNGDKITSAPIMNTASDRSTAGTYPIEISGGVVDHKNNYDIIYKKGTLTVKEPEVKLDYAIKSMDKVYGDAAFTNPLTISGDAGDIMYSANNPNVVTIDAVSGEVKIVGAGDAIITASAKNNVKASYSISIKKATLELKADNKSITVGEALPDFTYTATGLVNGDTVTETPIMSTASDGTTAGKFDIIASGGQISNGQNYNITYKHGKLTVLGKEPQNISYKDITITKNYGDAKFVNILTKTAVEGAITYISNNPAVAEIDETTGEVTIVGVGDATITATAAETVNKAASTASYILVVNKKEQIKTNKDKSSKVLVNLPETLQKKVIINKIPKVEIRIDENTQLQKVKMDLNLNAVTAINKQANADVQLSAVRIDASKISTEAKDAIGNRPAFDLKATYDNGKNSITSFGSGSVSVGIPYTLQQGEVASNVCAVYVDDNGKVNYLANSSYDSKTKTVRFITSHFSVYGVGYKENTVPVNFTDITDHWAKQDIEFVANKGLMSGTGNNLFTPDGAMTRGMFVTTLGRLAGVNAADYTSNKFSDVQVDAYYAPYVNWAAEKGIVSGTAETTFSPGQSVTRQEMAVMMSNYVKDMGSKLPQTHQAITFVDSSAIASWSTEAINQMQTAGIISGRDDNSFDPAGTATRGEAASVLYRFVEAIAK